MSTAFEAKRLLTKNWLARHILLACGSAPATVMNDVGSIAGTLAKGGRIAVQGPRSVVDERPTRCPVGS